MDQHELTKKNNNLMIKMDRKRESGRVAMEKKKELAKKINGKKQLVNLPGIGMGGKYMAMEFIRGAKGKATYLGRKKTKLHEEKHPSDWAKSVRRHEEK